MSKKGSGFNFIFLGLIIILMIGAGIYYLKYLPKIPQKAVKPIYSETAPKIKESDEKMKVSLFFSSPDDEHLVVESREIYRTASRIDQVKQAIIALIEGPKKDLDPVIPEGTVLKEVFLDKDGTAYVDFSIELVKNHSGGSSGEIMTIYGIVNTLCANFSEIKSVQIIVEGKEIETISGHLDARYPFSMKNI